MLRKALVFCLQFLPLFALFLWLYLKLLPLYQPAAVDVANAVMHRLSSPTHLEIEPDGPWRAYTLQPDGGRKPLRSWAGFMSHLVFLSLALLPPLLLATPGPVAQRLKLLVYGLLLLFGVHVLCLVSLVRLMLGLVHSPGNFHYLWLLRLVYASGQISAAALWVLLSWRRWMPAAPEENAE